MRVRRHPQVLSIQLCIEQKWRRCENPVARKSIDPVGKLSHDGLCISCGLLVAALYASGCIFHQSIVKLSCVLSLRGAKTASKLSMMPSCCVQATVAKLSIECCAGLGPSASMSVTKSSVCLAHDNPPASVGICSALKP